jgi:hypothetical protein
VEQLSAILDGSWFDICSLSGGILYAVHRCRKSTKQQKWISRTTGLDVANGVSLFPLSMLVLVSFSSSALSSLLLSNKLILSVAGLLALLAILEDS